MQPLLGVAFRPQEGHQVEGSQPSLAARGDKDERGLTGGVGDNGGVGRSVHGGHARTVVLSRETVNVHLQLYRANRRVEVEQSSLEL